MTTADRIAPEGYVPRIVDDEMRRALAAMPAVLIEGPRACGKTWTGRRFAGSAAYLDDSAGAALDAGMSPASLLEGESPRLLDEWQLAPKIWNPMRRACDTVDGAGRFILTGSVDPPDDITRHSGAGRIIRVRMRPMSLFESGESDGGVSLADLLEGDGSSAPDSGLALNDVLALACRGGWPRTRQADTETAGDAARAYLDEISRTDVSRVDAKERDPVRVGRLLASLARNAATEVKHTVLAADTAAAGEAPLERRTVADYLTALKRLFVVEEVPAWRPHLASRAQARRAPKIHLADPSLTAAALNVGVDQLIRDLRFAGRLFESMAIRDLQIYARANRCSLSHYRDSDGLEIDLIIQQSDGRWAAAEVKLGGAAAIEKGARTLQRLQHKLNQERTGDPSALMVITASGYAYQRKDGVSVVPMTALGP
ncbi:MAG: DUF4143 domain-containing protein [Acidimicrobiaceae bacterium]|nr:DUF4143 domain-containing protein [Acidimicrobiaceae bacterium]MCY4280034.1 DUF4143 domain-containing protein [Acidimicrobiaceae bacterium]MCY4295030.1 DUF4143 domain-containing protein [Acidimicrobiaceae bacterium]